MPTSSNQHRLVFAASVSLVLVGALAVAQVPQQTRYLLAHTGPNRLLGLDASGNATTVIPISVVVDTLDVNATNTGLVYHDGYGLYEIDLATERSTLLTTLNGVIYGAAVDEDGGLAWLLHGGLYRSASVFGTQPMLLSTILGAGARGPQGPIWFGSSGGYAASLYAPTRSAALHFFDRTGRTVRTVQGFGLVRDCAWSPRSGDVFVLESSPSQILRVPWNGVVTTVASLAIAPLKLRVANDAPSGAEEAIVAEFDGTRPAGPQRLRRIDLTTGVGVTVTTSTSPQMHVVEPRSRSLWAGGPWVAGSVGRLNLNPGPAHAGEFYRIALSLNHTPGISVGGHHLSLIPDALFFVTAGGDVPGLTRGFTGRLDASGRATSPPSVTIPNVVRGVRLFGGGIFFAATGVTGTTNCWGITIR